MVWRRKDRGQLTALWLEEQLQYTWLRVLAGVHADFWQVTGDALDFTLETLGNPRSPALREAPDEFLPHARLLSRGAGCACGA